MGTFAWFRILLIFVALIVGLFKLVDWAAEYLWFETLGYLGVFWTIRLLKLFLLLIGFALALAYFWTNAQILSARLNLVLETKALVRWSGGLHVGGSTGPSKIGRGQGGGHVHGITRDMPLVAATTLALIFGIVLYGSWNTLLRYVWAQDFGVADPIFGHDIGFYLFRVPLFELVQNSVLAATATASALLLIAYVYAGVFRFQRGRGIIAPAKVRQHIAINLALFLLALAGGFYLDRFALLQSSSGAVFGAGHTDVHVKLPALSILIGATVALAVAVLLPWVTSNRLLLPVLVGGYLIVLLAGTGLVPWSVQSFVVEPNELELEQPYLRHNIAFTRDAYRLDRIEERIYSGSTRLGPAALARNRETIDNIRLWDWRPLSETFRQFQQIRTYYEFNDVDVDRYQIGGQYRQVMLSVRELSEDLPGRSGTWLNRRLQFTHGHGLVMTPTAEKSEQGSPELVIRDLPPRTVSGPAISQPAIYYGEANSGYRIVATSVPEFDYPRGDENVYSSYTGDGGVAIDGWWRRLLFAWHQLDAGILLTSYIEPGSRIQLWRGLQDRVARVAPFLLLDRDPYAVVVDERVYWVQDAYTVSSAFPYSEEHPDGFNYIRNSVKVVVDAYEGDIEFYVMDTDDPVLAVYQRAFPGLFRDLGAMPEGLRDHLRYPQDLFEAQVALYRVYHMTVPQVFYNGEDVWTAPWEKYGGEQIRMRPYYVLMKLPGEQRLQFLLMTPLSPANRDNMIAWITARCDFPGYGEVIVYKLPKERLIVGPIQVEAMIDQDTVISQQLSLWDQRGSRVIRGNLLVIPIEQSFIYVEPVYLIAEGTGIPQLKRLIVSDGERLAMEPTLDEAIHAAFGERQSLEENGPVTDSLTSAAEALQSAEEALRSGDWDGFGRAMQALKELLGEQPAALGR